MRRIASRVEALALALLLGAPGLLLAQPIDVEDWFAVRTESFVLRSNAPAERARAVAGVLESFRTAFSQMAPDMRLESPVPTRILAFRDAPSFERFVLRRAGAGARVLGQFLTHPDGNFITLNADPEFSGSMGVVLHEYVHHLVAHNLPGVPRWFNEGLAEYYSTLAVEGAQAVVGRPVQRHLDWLRRHGRIEISEILEAGSDEAHEVLEVGHFYAVSWGLVHYLLSSGELPAAGLADFLLAAGQSEAPTDLFETVFEIRVDELEARLRSYLLSETLPAAGHTVESARSSTAAEPARPGAVLCDLAALAMRLGEAEEAARLFELALDYDPESAAAYAGLGYLRSVGQNFEDAEALFARAMDLIPNDAQSFHLYGRHLLARIDAARRDGDRALVERLAPAAVEAFRAALLVDPGFAEASALLGYAHLFGSLDPAGGVGPLERALELLPGRPDVTFQLLQLEVRRGEVTNARRLAAGEIRRRGGEEWQRRAEEEIERVILLQRAEAALAEERYREGLELISEAIGITTEPELRRALAADLDRLEKQFGDR